MEALEAPVVRLSDDFLSNMIDTPLQRSLSKSSGKTNSKSASKNTGKSSSKSKSKSNSVIDSDTQYYVQAMEGVSASVDTIDIKGNGKDAPFGVTEEGEEEKEALNFVWFFY